MADGAGRGDTWGSKGDNLSRALYLGQDAQGASSGVALAARRHRGAPSPFERLSFARRGVAAAARALRAARGVDPQPGEAAAGETTLGEAGPAASAPGGCRCRPGSASAPDGLWGVRHDVGPL